MEAKVISWKLVPTGGALAVHRAGLRPFLGTACALKTGVLL